VTTTSSSSRAMSRRSVLVGACGTCAATVTGCATYTAGTPAPTPAAGPGPQVGASVTAAPAPGAAAGATLGPATDVPVGGGKIFAAEGVVVSQPEEGTFVAFSTTCTHQGCAVTTITGETINCPCHGSTFALADGTVVTGPATRALAKKDVTVESGRLTLA